MTLTPKIYILVILFSLYNSVKATSQENQLDSLIDTFLNEDDDLYSLFNEDKVYHFVYINTEFNNKAFYSGREIGLDQHNVSGQISYFNSKGLYAGISGAWYSQLDPKYGTTVVSIGYSKSLKKYKNLSLRSFYSKYIYNYGDQEYEPDYKSSLRVGTTLKNSKVGSRLDLSFFMGNEFATNLTWNIYSKVKLYQFGRFNKIQFVPQFTIFLGEEDVEYEMQLRGAISQIFTENKFGFMNAQFNLPIRVSYNNFDAELGYTYNIPNSLDPEYEYENTSSLSISIGYILDF